ncbi:MAG TPA: hypothetical protein VGQ99_16405 [Tepidisphaeraceae bacterium]|nr:hypothetical protein [Tepidisphaeraceae bacterium]
MICKSIKTIVLAGLGVALVGGLLFGRDAVSYFRSAVGSVRDVAKDNVPIEFELRRARDLLNDIIPEMQANIRVIAQQEVEISNLRTDIAQTRKGLADEQAKVQKLREVLLTQQTNYSINGLNYSRRAVTDELSRRFDRFKEAEVILSGKQRLLENREKSLLAGIAMLEKTRSQKALLENQVESLEGQFRLVQAAAVGSKLHIDHSKLAQTQKVLADIKKQLDVAERVLAHESRFTEEIKVDTVDEKELVASVDDHFGAAKSSDNAAPTAQGPDAPVVASQH